MKAEKENDVVEETTEEPEVVKVSDDKKKELIEVAKSHLVQVRDDSPALMAAITQGISQGRPVSEMQGYLDLYERILNRQAEAQFNAAMQLFQSICPPVPKTGKGQYGNYAPLEEIKRVIMEPMAEAGLSYYWQGKHTENTVESSCFIRHISGHERCSTFVAEIDRRAEDKGANEMQRRAAAKQYANRQSLVDALGITSADVDLDGFHGRQKVDDVLEICPIGKEWKGKHWSEVDIGMIKWICEKYAVKNDRDKQIVNRAREELGKRSKADPVPDQTTVDRTTEGPQEKRNLAAWARDITQATNLEELNKVWDSMPEQFQSAINMYYNTRRKELGGKE